MQIHYRGYESGDPRVKPAAGHGVDRPRELPDEMDVLIVGTGPAAAVVTAQLSRFPSIDARAIEKRPGRLEVGQADGIQARSVETFQAFGFAGEVIEEAYRNVEMCFWTPDPADPSRIVRASRAPDDATGISEFPHIYVNQSRILDYFLRDAERAPGRIVPDYGIEFVDCEIDPSAAYPVSARIRRRAAADAPSPSETGAGTGLPEPEAKAVFPTEAIPTNRPTASEWCGEVPHGHLAGARTIFREDVTRDQGKVRQLGIFRGTTATSRRER